MRPYIALFDHQRLVGLSVPLLKVDMMILLLVLIYNCIFYAVVSKKCDVNLLSI